MLILVREILLNIGRVYFSIKNRTVIFKNLILTGKCGLNRLDMGPMLRWIQQNEKSGSFKEDFVISHSQI